MLLSDTSKLCQKVSYYIPLVFSAAGGIGPIDTAFYKHLASLLSDSPAIRQFVGCTTI